MAIEGRQSTSMRKQQQTGTTAGTTSGAHAAQARQTWTDEHMYFGPMNLGKECMQQICDTNACNSSKSCGHRASDQTYLHIIMSNLTLRFDLTSRVFRTYQRIPPIGGRMLGLQ